MSVTIMPARLTRLALLTLTGATALSVAACGGSNDSKPSTSANPSSPASANGKNWVNGMIASVSGDAIQVTQQTGNATVDFTPSTKISEVTPAHLTDVTPGACVVTGPTPESANAGGPVTAQFVRVNPAVDGKCAEPKHPAGAPPSGAPEAHRPVQGTVASVAGNNITVTTVDANGNSAPANVTVTDATKYTKLAAANAQAVAQGKCVTARGTKDNSGKLQATAITLSPADNGACPHPAGKKHKR